MVVDEFGWLLVGLSGAFDMSFKPGVLHLDSAAQKLTQRISVVLVTVGIWHRGLHTSSRVVNINCFIQLRAETLLGCMKQSYVALMTRLVE